MDPRIIRNIGCVVAIVGASVCGAALGLWHYHGMPGSVALPAAGFGLVAGLAGLVANEGQGWQ